MRYLAFLFILTSCSTAPETPADLVSGFKKLYDDAASISYVADYRVKYLSEEDTLHFPVEVRMVRDRADTIFGGMVRYEHLKTDQQFSNLYDLDTIYSYVPEKGRVTTYRPHLGEDWAIKGNAAGSAIETFYLNPDRLGKILLDSLSEVSMTKTEDGGYYITVSEPDEEPFYDQKRQFWFDKDLMLTRFTYRVGFQGNYQYSDWQLKDIEFNAVTSADIEDERDAWLDTADEVVAYKPEQYNIPLLEAGVSAPSFSGTIYKDKSPWTLDDARGKPLIMDFWYMSCMPCIKAIPHLNEVYEEFGDRLTVIGVNSLDNNEKDINKLPKFIGQNELSYPILLTEPSTDSLYQVRAYPSLYVLDKEGKVIFNQIGFNEALSDTLRSVLQSHL